MNRIKKSILIVGLVSFGHFWHDIFTAFITPLLPVIKESLDLNYIHTGGILVASKLPSLLSANIAGYSEKHNPKWFVIFCPLITAISISLLGISGSYPILLTLVFIAGISSAGFHIPVPTLLKKSAPNRIVSAMTAFQIGGEAARTLGPIVIVLILATIGFKRMYLLIPASIIVSLLFYLAFNKIDLTIAEKNKTKGSVLETLKQGKFLFLLVAGISLQKAILSTVVRSFLPLYLNNQGESLLLANGALSIVQGSAVAGVITAGFFIDKIGASKILYTIISASMLLVILFTFLPQLPLVPILILLGFFSFSSTPAIYTLIQNYGFTFPTTANGIFMTFSFGISSLVLLAAGGISDYISINYMYKLFALLSLVGIPLLILLKALPSKSSY
ncbi:MAG: MFS transporter [Spirochaetota bacterium]|nr:MFS transporter [Spirochaetota bacterium]